ncbi:hypothetical protein PISMIDRAFT_19975 [Pisolithus microcarpus 441]|uniref:Uncharacterized protein n=1 Tax=Pisolithus microcarpus 441 TaxID=765257 RepID=A0A0C9YA24_9AGAM|nr:hypothetical protein PISMIDRAFT_19975 [Pisolithus microcarpus 441]
MFSSNRQPVDIFLTSTQLTQARIEWHQSIHRNESGSTYCRLMKNLTGLVVGNQRVSSHHQHVTDTSELRLTDIQHLAVKMSTTAFRFIASL